MLLYFVVECPENHEKFIEQCFLPPSSLHVSVLKMADSKSQRPSTVGMSEATLRYPLQQQRTKLGRYGGTFSADDENDFCDYLKILDEMCFGLTAKQLKRAAYQFAEKHAISHRFNKHSRAAGKDWFCRFIERHPEIPLRHSTSKSMTTHRQHVERFNVKMSALMDKYQFPPQSIYNMDEIGISTVPNHPPNALSFNEKRAVNKISSATKGLHVTTVNAVSATGHFIAPAFVFKRKRMTPELIENTPHGSMGMVSNSHFITDDLFLDWLSHFKNHSKASKDQPVLLILDSHASYISLKAIDFYRQNNIIALTLPPLHSHKMQPLDWGFHRSFKKYYARECRRWLVNHLGRVITIIQMTSIFTTAFHKAATVACAVESFSATGIWPWNPVVFTKVATSPKERTVTKQENPQKSNTIVEIEHDNFAAKFPVGAPVEAVASIPSEALDLSSLDHAIDCISQTLVVSSVESVTSSSTQDVTMYSMKAVAGGSGISQPASALRSSTIEMKEANVSAKMSPSLGDIIPTPSSQLKRASNWGHQEADVSSSSSNNQLEQEFDGRKNPKRAKMVSKEPKKSIKKIMTWRCGGCIEVFKEPIAEDWIQCMSCKVWWHENCTDYLGSGVFKCLSCE